MDNVTIQMMHTYWDILEHINEESKQEKFLEQKMIDIHDLVKEYEWRWVMKQENGEWGKRSREIDEEDKFLEKQMKTIHDQITRYEWRWVQTLDSAGISEIESTISELKIKRNDILHEQKKLHMEVSLPYHVQTLDNAGISEIESTISELNIKHNDILHEQKKLHMEVSLPYHKKKDDIKNIVGSDTSHMFDIEFHVKHSNTADNRNTWWCSNCNCRTSKTAMHICAGYDNWQRSPLYTRWKEQEQLAAMEFD